MSRHPVFQCQQCGDCCAGRGGIFVRPEEVAAMAAFLEMDEGEFSRRYVEPSSLGNRLAIAAGVCVFMEDNRCRVHPVKPFICLQWPFLPALLVDAEEFEGAKGACPGINPDCRHEDFVEAALKLNES
ncbi:MAG: YkgJ family cysteine cluster protein [Thermodesulfobacteriota bacterium]